MYIDSCVFYGSFFAFGYAIPLSLVCVLYGMMLHRLRNRKAPSTSAWTAANTTRSTVTAASRKSTRTSGNSDAPATSRQSSSKRRVTRLVIVVVVIFAASWLPAQVRNAAAETGATESAELENIAPDCTGNAIPPYYLVITFQTCIYFSSSHICSVP